MPRNNDCLESLVDNLSQYGPVSNSWKEDMMLRVFCTESQALKLQKDYKVRHNADSPLKDVMLLTAHEKS